MFTHRFCESFRSIHGYPHQLVAGATTKTANGSGSCGRETNQNHLQEVHTSLPHSNCPSPLVIVMRASACGATVDDRYDRRNVLSPSSRFCFASGYMSFPDSQDCSVDRDINVCLGFLFFLWMYTNLTFLFQIVAGDS